MKTSSLPVVDLWAYSLHQDIIDARTGMSYPLLRSADMESTVQRLSENAGSARVFSKPTWGTKGGLCLLFEDGKPVNMSEEAAFRQLKQRPYVFQPYIDQHPDMAAVNASSVNTIRLNILRDEKGHRRLVAPFAKFGRDGALVDNSGAGGITLPLDSESGRAVGPAFRHLKVGGETYSKHPDSRFELGEFTPPFFDEARELSMEASGLFPNRIIAWDIAITRDGPVIVEGNYVPSLDYIQMSVGGFRRDPDFSSMLSQFL